MAPFIYDVQVQAFLLLMGRAVVVFAIGWFVISLMLGAVDRIMAKRYPDAILRAFCLSVIGIGSRVLLMVSCLDMVGISVASLITALGAVGLALGLAMQDSLANLAQGVVILFSKPFTLGDYVEIDGLAGIIADMDLLHVTIHTPDGRRVCLTNSQTAKAKIINHSALLERRLEFVTEVATGIDQNKVIALLQSHIAAHPLALKEQAPVVFLSGYNPDFAQISCRVWVASKQYWQLYYTLMEEIRLLFIKEGIAFSAGKPLLRLEDKPVP